MQGDRQCEAREMLPQKASTRGGEGSRQSVGSVALLSRWWKAVVFFFLSNLKRLAK